MTTNRQPPLGQPAGDTKTGDRPVRRVVGLGLSMFWTAVAVFIIAVIVILYFVFR